MNLAQAYTYAALVCMGTGLDVGMVSAMHMLGLIVVQAVFCVGSGVPNFAIASSDITIALLNHKIVREVYAEDSRVPLHAQHDTALCVLCVCAVVQGALYLALGRMRAAEMVQYLPHPVVAGLLALTGCCVIRGALEMLQMRVVCTLTKDVLWGDETTEIKVVLKEILDEEYHDDEG